MSGIRVTVVDEEGKPVEHARVAFSARVITPRFLFDEAEALHLSAVDVRVAELAVRTDGRGFAELSERPAPKVFGVLGPLYVLGRAANMGAPTPYVDWLLTGGRLILRIDRTGYDPVTYIAKPGERVQIRLRRLTGDVVRGRVLDSAGRLLWGAYVEVLEEERGPVLATGSTDHEGRFEIAVRRPGSLTVSVHPPEEERKLGERAVTVRMVAGVEMDVRTVPTPPPAGPTAPAATVATKKEE